MSATLVQANKSPVLKPGEFDKISQLAYQHFGVDLRQGKQALVEARIGKKLRELNMTSFQVYYDYVTNDSTGNALQTMVDVLTTNHTSFFREPRHFDLLQNTIIPALQSRPQINIWSAACSSGEEPYSIAMTLLETNRELALAKVKIRASDISNRVLEVAKSGIYSAERVDKIPNELLHRYMLKGQRAAANNFRFKNEVRNMIAFERLNLMEPLPADYRCSVIFCRNIMIYFDKQTQESLVQRLTQNLEDGGYLFIGHSETLNAIQHGLEYLSPATYRKPGSLLGEKNPSKSNLKIGGA
jgi:chemotaxis protein methyltransferase CheR